MSIRYLSLVLVFIVAWAMSPHVTAQNEIQYVTEEYPPYNYSRNGELKGLSVELLTEMHQLAGLPLRVSSIKILPWRRAYKTAQKKEGHAVFSTTRTNTRENDFQWVGPIIETKVVILTTNSTAPIKNIYSLFSSQIGVVRKDIGEESLINAGFPVGNLVRTDDVRELVDALHSNQLNYIAYEENVARWWISQTHLPQEDFKAVYTLVEGELYYSYNTAIESRRLERLQQALNSLKISGDGSPTIYQRIIDKYF
ncbi:substrate-binding periplasmic protein [Vibrio sp. B183]|uniref:substrate-binding periplasmic protein n=1 Tax=Vibrio sp. B183 TaxID=1526762 RepID=UPI0005715277|nr:transporter substrate-binding domain-containing protein [Vibrio sp. B183]